MLQSLPQSILIPPNETGRELTFEFGQQTIPTNWEESYDYSWNLTQPTGYGIVPTKDGNE